MVCIARKSFHYKVVVIFMDHKYVDDEDMVQFNIQSDFTKVTEQIFLPLSLVEDMQKHIGAFDGVVSNPSNSVIFHALCVYMDYINAELVRFDMVKADVERCMELDLQEMVVE